MKRDDFGEKIDRVSMVDQVFTRIKHMVINGTLQPGDRLPSENDLAAMLDVNRLTVRMALQKLSAVGVLETRVGSGTYVKEFSLEDLFSNFGDIIFSKTNKNDISELRQLIEVESSKRAAERATFEDKTVLKMKLNEYLQCSKKIMRKNENSIAAEEFCDFVKSDLAFHTQVCLSSHNGMFYEIFLLTEEMLRKNIAEEIHSRVFFEKEEFDNHTLIYDAILKGDSEKAGLAALAVLGVKVVEQ